MTASADENDPVVKEVDVFLVKALAEKLFLYQYPLRPACMSYENTTHLDTKIKFQQQKVELEMGMDINSNSYCYARGEQIANAVDSNEHQRPMFPSRVMDRHALSSVQATTDSSRYAAGVYHDGVLHITPVKGVVQMRPNFHYFDKAEENHKAYQASLEKEGSQSEEEEEEAKPVQLRFANANKMKKVEEAAMEEEWQKMKYIQPTEERAKRERHLLYCDQDNECSEFSATSREYLKILSPQTEEDSSSPADLPYGVVSLSKLKSMDLKDQIKALLTTMKVVQFSKLCALLGGGLEESVVIQGVSQYAHLVQGCWVVKSEVLYPAGSKSSVSGLPAEKLWPSRDYIMLSLNRKHVLSRKEVAASTKLPAEELRDILEQIAMHRPPQGWKFRMTTDVDFLQRHHEVCLEEVHAWKHKYKIICQQLNLSEEQVDWSEHSLPGLFLSGQYRRPITPRRRVPQRRRTVSQTSPAKLNADSEVDRKPVLNDAIDTLLAADFASKSNNKKSLKEDISLISVKPEPISPIRNHASKIDTTESKIDTQTSKIDSQPTDDFYKSTSRAIKNISTLLSDDEEKAKKVTAKKSIRKKARQIESDSESDTNEKTAEDVEMPLEENCNEVEVMDIVETTKEPTHEIFIPPVIVKRENIDKPPSHIFLKEVKRFCKESLLSGCLNLADLKEVLAVRQQAAGSILCTGVTDSMLIDCLKQTGAHEIDLPWGEENERLIPFDKRRLFMYPELKEPNDKYRRAAMELFENSLSIKKKEILEHCSTTLNSQPSAHMYAKILGEFCENHNGSWYLFGVHQTLRKFNPKSI